MCTIYIRPDSAVIHTWRWHLQNLTKQKHCLKENFNITYKVQVFARLQCRIHSKKVFYQWVAANPWNNSLPTRYVELCNIHRKKKATSVGAFRSSRFVEGITVLQLTVLKKKLPGKMEMTYTNHTVLDDVTTDVANF